MSEGRIPTYVLLERLKSPDLIIRDDAFQKLVYRFGGLFRHYAKEKLQSDDDAHSAMNDTFVKLYTSRDRYQQLQCQCEPGCVCVERAAEGYVWTIHKNTIKDWYQKNKAEQLSRVTLDEMLHLIETNNASPEAYVEYKIKQAALYNAWDSLSESDRQLLAYKPKPGPRNAVQQRMIQQGRSEAWMRFRVAVKKALAEEE